MRIFFLHFSYRALKFQISLGELNLTEYLLDLIKFRVTQTFLGIKMTGMTIVLVWSILPTGGGGGEGREREMEEETK